MRSVVVLAVLATSCSTITLRFAEVTPVRSVPLLAGKTKAAMQGTSCSRICTSRNEYTGIEFCAIATLEAAPSLACRVSHTRAGVQVERDHLIEIPKNFGAGFLPERGPLPIHVCKAAGCETRFTSPTDAITACAVDLHHYDRAEQHLVCSFENVGPPTTM